MMGVPYVVGVLPGIDAIVLARPLALAALALPILLLLYSVRRNEPQRRLLGTTRFFGPEEAAGEDAKRRRLPPSKLLAMGALVAGAVALAGPGVEPSRPEGSSIRMVIDRSPSMFLPVKASGGSVTRLESALNRFRAWAEEREALMDGRLFVEVVGQGPSGLVHWSELQVPGAPGGGQGEEEPLWPLYDQTATVWITDREPHRSKAGIVASGGELVPGMTAAGAKGSVFLDASGREVFDAQRSSPGSFYVGPSVPRELADLMALWAASRGLAASSAPEEGTSLRLLGAEGEDASSSARTEQAGRDGWQISVRAVGGAQLGPSVRGSQPAVWLASTAGTPLIAQEPGVIRVGFTAFVELPEEPSEAAALALSFTDLFDRTRLPHPGVVSSRERVGQGTALVDPPADLVPLDEYAEGADRLGEDDAARFGRRALAGLALIASALAAGAAALRLRGL